MNRGIKGKLAALVGAAGTFTATVLSAAFNTKEYNSFGFLVQVGAFSFDVTNSIILQMSHSDDNVTFTDCAAADYEGGVIKTLNAAADASKVHAVGYVGSKQYVKLNMVEVGTVSVAYQYQPISLDPLSKPAI